MGTDEILQEQNKILKEVSRWIKVSNMDKVKKALSDEFNDDNKILVYHFSDGRSNTDIEKVLGKRVTGRTVTNWWKSWFRLGFMDTYPKYKGRLIKNFDLNDFGIAIPELKIEKTEIVKEENKDTEEEFTVENNDEENSEERNYEEGQKDSK